MKRYKDVPLLGLDAIALIFVPSYLVYAKLIDVTVISTLQTGIKDFNIIPLFIAVLIIGSIFCINRQTLFGNLAQIVLPLVIASIAAIAVGAAVGIAVGLTWFHALFMVITPIMAGGVNAGALPLSAGYSSVTGSPPGEILALLLPPIIVGNLTAMIFAGALNLSDRSSPIARSSSSTEGAEVLEGPAEIETRSMDASPIHRSKLLAVAIIFILVFAFIGSVISRATGLNQPLILLTLAALLHLTGVLPKNLQQAIVAVYRFCVAAFTYPILILVGLLFTPWTILIEGFSWANILTVTATVGSLAGTGYICSRWINLKPTDVATITLTRAAMGGTGDVAILSAADRLHLMPFAQIATRAGGAATVFAALGAAQHVGG